MAIYEEVRNAAKELQDRPWYTVSPDGTFSNIGALADGEGDDAQDIVKVELTKQEVGQLIIASMSAAAFMDMQHIPQMAVESLEAGIGLGDRAFQAALV